MRIHRLVQAVWALAVLSLLAAGPGAPLAQPAALFTLTQKWQRCPAWWCETGWYASPAVADIDNDGTQEVLWGGYTLMSVNGATGAIEWIRPQSGNRLWPSIVVADVLGNGSPLEVVTASHGGLVTVYNASGAPLAGWPVQVNGQSNELRTLAVADLDGDKVMEIVVATTGSGPQHWYVYQSNGSLRPGWPRLATGSPGYAAGAYNENIGIADLDGDGRGELIGPSDVHYISAFQDNGAEMLAHPRYGTLPNGGGLKPWSRVGVHVSDAVDLVGYANCGTEHRPNFANSAASIGDLLGNGTLQVVVVGNVHNCGTSPYTDLYELPFVFNADRSRWAAGGYDWTAVPVPDGSAAPLSQDYNVIESSLPNPVLADLDGDGQKEILYASYDGRVHAYWLDKTEHAQWPFEVTPPGSPAWRFASEPVVADLNNDGQAEVIFASWTKKGSNQTGKLYIVNAQGGLVQSIDIPRAGGSTSGGALAAPTLANIDGDANLEVVLGTLNMGLVAFDLADSANARIRWGTGRGSYQRTGALMVGSLAGSTKAVSDRLPDPGDTLLYTLRLVNPGPLLETVRVTDTLPAHASFVGGSATATSGSLAVNATTLTWTGPVTPSIGVTLTYQMAVNGGLSGPTVIANTALLDDGLGHVLQRRAIAIVDALQMFAPLVMR